MQRFDSNWLCCGVRSVGGHGMMGGGMGSGMMMGGMMGGGMGVG